MVAFNPVLWRTFDPDGGVHHYCRKPENVAAEVAWATEDGRATVHHGDCLDVMRSMADGSVDAVVTDPPYGMAYVSAWRKRENDVTVPVAGDDEFDPEFAVAWATEALRLTRDGGALYSFTSDHHIGEFRDAFRAAGWNVKRSLVWVKNAWTSGDLEGDFGHQTEFVVFASKGRHLLRGARTGNVLDYRRIPPGDLVHSCQKPAPLIAHLIRASVAPGGTILDPFAGSGTTAIAAREEGCGAVLIESNERNVEIAKARIAHEAAQGSLFK